MQLSTPARHLDGHKMQTFGEVGIALKRPRKLFCSSQNLLYALRQFFHSERLLYKAITTSRFLIEIIKPGSSILSAFCNLALSQSVV